MTRRAWLRRVDVKVSRLARAELSPRAPVRVLVPNCSTAEGNVQAGVVELSKYGARNDV